MRKKFIIILLIFIAILFIGIYIHNSGAPDLTITLNNKSLQTKTPLYGWNTLFKHIVKDNRTPLELAKSLDAITVKPNTILYLKFSRKVESIEISLWSEESVKILPSANAIGVPSSKGIFVYRVVGQWKQGTAIYILKINVD